MVRLQQHRHALGSDVVLTLIVENELQATNIFDELWQSITLFEATFSRFQPDSELTYVNQNAGQRTQISQEFEALITKAKEMALATAGLYNPFILPTLQAAGYKGSWPNPTQFDTELDFASREVVAATKLKIARGWLSMPTNTALDFGGIGKGYLLDQLVDGLDAKVVKGYWFSLGGDIVCGGFDVGGVPWRVGIQQAEGNDMAGYAINKTGEKLAIATSGITKRRGTGWHHIIDPRINMPAKTDVLTVTVCTPSATTADICAKCLVIVGSDNAEEFTSKHAIASTLVQYKTGSRIQVATTGSIITV